MKRLLFATLAAALVAGCASGPAAEPAAKPKTTADLILGKWTCSTTSEGQTINATLDYAASGKASYDMSMTGNAGGTSLAITGTGSADWAVQPDGKIKETITAFKVGSGKIGGNVMPAAMLQGMVGDMLVNQSSISTPTFSGDTLTMVDEGNVTTNCKR